VRPQFRLPALGDALPPTCSPHTASPLPRPSARRRRW
jgi:hypothetical protein